MDPILNVDIFDEYDEDKARSILDMYFYTVNFWRECVSAYISQQEQQMRQRVLTRLSEILEWEQKIKEVLANAPDDYVPPTCVFLTESSVSRTNMSRFKRTGTLVRTQVIVYNSRASFHFNINFICPNQVSRNRQRSGRRRFLRHKPAKSLARPTKQLLKLQRIQQLYQRPGRWLNEQMTGE